MSETLDPPATAEDTSPEAQELAQIRARLATAEQQRIAAENRASSAEHQARQAGGAVQSAQEAALDTRLAAEQTRLAAAEAAYQAARENGDVRGEIAASKELARATQLITACEMEKANIAARKAQMPASHAQPQPQNLPGPEAQRWLQDHPLVNSDRVYNAAVTKAHNDAVAARIEVESPDYFRFVDTELRAKFGDNHGREPAPMAAPTIQTPPRAPAKPAANSYGAPRSAGPTTPRGNSESEAEAKVCDYLTKYDPDGGVITPEILKQHADVVKMSYADYLKSQMDIMAERRGGKGANSGWIK